MLVLMLPREMLTSRTRELPGITARRISGRRGVGAVLSPFLSQLGQRLLLGELTPTIEVCDAVLDLLTATRRWIRPGSPPPTTSPCGTCRSCSRRKGPR
jgi:hypothetical protein